MKKGVVYTPRFWADWAVERFSISRKWLDGSVLLDPGCGEGALTEAVIRSVVATGYTPTRNDFSRLKCIDRDETALLRFSRNIRESFGLKIPNESLIHSDFLLDDPQVKADLILSNPPWVTFGDLEPADKVNYKPIFRESGLAPDPKSLLLGGSRIDIAALFVAMALNRDAADNSEAYFFLPSSLFRGEGAHSAFRRLSLPGGRSFALTELFELENGIPFPGAGTRYCFAAYKADKKQSWPISWFNADATGGWQELRARPVDDDGSPLVPYPEGSPPDPPPRINVPAGAIPRQGVNCGGGSEVFLFEKVVKVGDSRVRVTNKKGTEGYLPADLVYPLMSPSCFTGNSSIEEPERWIFLPYKQDGKVLSAEELGKWPDAVRWLEEHRTLLENRKGALLRRYCAKGVYWALLGVGPYAFAPWKLAWESYGRSHFIPHLFSSRKGEFWQGNQALHAFIPFGDQDSAMKAFKEFSSPSLSKYLKSLGGAATKNWAQPGRIKRLLSFRAQ